LTGTFWDPHGEARAALRVIVSDPHYGVPALSNPQIVFNLVKDLLPDAPREANVLIAAAEARVAGLLVDYTRQGMDPGTAAHLVTAYFAHRTSLTPDACNWAVSELAIALGMSPHGFAPPSAPAAGAAWLDDPPPLPATPAGIGLRRAGDPGDSGKVVIARTNAASMPVSGSPARVPAERASAPGGPAAPGPGSARIWRAVAASPGRRSPPGPCSRSPGMPPRAAPAPPG